MWLSAAVITRSVRNIIMSLNWSHTKYRIWLFNECEYMEPQHRVLYTNIDQKLVNPLNRLLNCEIAGLDCRVMTTEYRTRAQCIHMYHLFFNALVHVIYSVVSGQYSYTNYNTSYKYSIFFNQNNITVFFLINKSRLVHCVMYSL